MGQDYLKEFKDYLECELGPAINELGKIGETSRRHLQKLVFTNLIDRFDYCIDKTLLKLLEASDEFQDEILGEHNKPINESEILKLMLTAETPHQVAMEKLKDTLRRTILHKRHSEKLSKLLSVMDVEEVLWRKPRVNPSLGKILNTFTVHNSSVPASICGYADWLYSRRNAIVHGGGQCKWLDRDLKQLKKKFNCDPGKTVKLSLASIKNAAQFYSDLLDKHLFVKSLKIRQKAQKLKKK